MRWLGFVKSSVGCKVLVALTGIGLLFFVVAHLLGTLKVFEGAASLNEYAEFFRTLPPYVFWGARGGLLATFLLHVFCAIRLHRMNRAARPLRYEHEATIDASWASRHMLLTGLVLFAFIVFHLLHFTARVVPVGSTLDPQSDIYEVVISSFQVGWVTFSYVVAMLLFGFHLLHGIASLSQTLGVRSRRNRQPLLMIANGLTVALILGNCAMPMAVFFGGLGSE